ncbi:viral A-type inclusion protein [Reticulomyxa filosa]|uniref:Viral A-type inclusion protein n=1 Tax=Reticulomyxa filosa TaxID=46433 RepID=X6NKA2_RETFI|nr:viral A-type inclusion protein [Reticulomyxa filosa]|eukprot:ETO26376.1 viral A-type inclusion protein [Reticulomyxa filosa]
MSFSSPRLSQPSDASKITTTRSKDTLYALAEQMDLEQTTHRKVTEEQHNYFDFTIKSPRKELDKIKYQLDQTKADLETEKNLRKKQEKESEELLRKEAEHKIKIESYQQLEQKTNTLTIKLKEEIHKLLEEKYLEKNKLMQKNAEIDALNSKKKNRVFGVICLEACVIQILLFFPVFLVTFCCGCFVAAELQLLKKNEREQSVKISDLSLELSQNKAFNTNIYLRMKKYLNLITANADIGNFKHDILLLENEKIRLRDQLMDMSVKNTSLTNSLHNKEIELENYKTRTQVEIETIEKQLHESKVEAQAEKEDLQKLFRESEESRNTQLFELQSKLLKTENELEGLKCMLHFCFYFLLKHETIQFIRREKKGLEGEMVKYANKCEELEKKLDEIEVANATKTNKIQKINAEMSMKNKELQLIKVDNLELSGKCEKLQREKNELLRKVEAQDLAKEQLHSLVHQLQNLTSENALLKNKFLKLVSKPDESTTFTHRSNEVVFGQHSCDGLQMSLDELQKWRKSLSAGDGKKKYSQHDNDKGTRPFCHYLDKCRGNSECTSKHLKQDITSWIDQLTLNANAPSHRCCSRLQHL